MYNDSIETLLLRHYGGNAPTPPRLEQRLLTSVQQEAIQMRQQARVVTQISERRISRRHAVKLVALSSAGLGMLGAGLEMLESTLLGSETALPVH